MSCDDRFVELFQARGSNYFSDDNWERVLLPQLNLSTAKWMQVTPAKLWVGPDLLVGSKDPGIVGFLLHIPGRNVTQWPLRVLSSQLSWIMYLGAHDINEDGNVDIVLTDRQAGIVWFEHPGRKKVWGTWRRHDVFRDPVTRTGWLSVYDINGDGHLDLGVLFSINVAF